MTKQQIDVLRELLPLVDQQYRPHERAKTIAEAWADLEARLLR